MAPSEYQINLKSLQSSMLSFAMILTSNSRQAYNLVQDANTEALEREHEYDGADFRGWMFTLVRNRYIALRHGATALDVAETEMYTMPVTRLETPEGCYSGDELQQALTSLPDSHRHIFTLHIKGYTERQIARRLNLSVWRVRRSIRTSGMKIRL